LRQQNIVLLHLRLATCNLFSFYSVQLINNWYQNSTHVQTDMDVKLYILSLTQSRIQTLDNNKMLTGIRK